MDHIGKVKELRADFEKEVDIMKEMYMTGANTSIPVKNQAFFPTHLVTSVLALEEAKMWLGQELGRIKQLQDKEEVIAPTEKEENTDTMRG